MRRRQLLTASAIAVAGLAGCSGGSDSESTEDGGSGGGGDDLSSPSSSIETFYSTLYGDDDIEATNELYHPESEAPELTPEDFEDFGGVESIESDIENTEVVSQEDGRARVHVDVAYSTPVGSATNTDWFVLRQQDGEWLVSLWLPKSTRDGMSEEEAEGAMQQA